MGKQIEDVNDVIWQKSISFPFRVRLFLQEHPDFKIHKFCQVAVDEQIKLIDKRFLPNEKKTN